MSERRCEVAEKFPPGEFIRDELDARGWSLDDLQDRIPDPIDKLSVGMIASVDDKNLILDEQTAAALGKAFGISPEYFINLDSAWRAPEHQPRKKEE